MSSSTKAGTNLPEIHYITKAEVKLKSPSGPRFLSYRTVFWIPTLVSEVVSALSECGKPVTQIQGAGSTIMMSAWVPGPIIRAAASSQLEEFHAENSGHDTPSEPIIYTPVSTVSFVSLFHVFDFNFRFSMPIYGTELSSKMSNLVYY